MPVSYTHLAAGAVCFGLPKRGDTLGLCCVQGTGFCRQDVYKRQALAALNAQTEPETALALLEGLLDVYKRQSSYCPAVICIRRVLAWRRMRSR